MAIQEKPMKTIGILGGMSSAATGEYYKLINQKVREMKGGYEIAELLICSVNFGNIERFVREEDWKGAGRYLAEKAQQLEQGGAVCVFLATNTMHRVREDIKAAIGIPFIDIFETVSKVIRSQGCSRIGILGTYPVMSDPFFVDTFKEYGIDLVAPDLEDRKEIDRIIFEEMTHFKFLDSSKEFFIQTIKKLAQQGAQGVILGCTEIKMLITQEDIPDVPLFDTTELHCDMAAKICTGEIALGNN